MSAAGRPLRPLLLALLVLLMGACIVTTPPEDDTDAGRRMLQQFREQNAVRYDLTSAPTAQDLGVTAGRDSAIFDRDGADYWTVSFLLPGGSTFTTSRAIGVGVFIPNEPFALNSVSINAQADGLDALALELQDAVEKLGVEPAGVEAFLEAARRDSRGAQGSGINQVFRGQQFGYLRTSVDARVPSDMERVALNYSFHWGSSGG